MPTLKVGARSIDVSRGRVVVQAERMGKLAPSRREHRLEKAKALLTRGGKGRGGKHIKSQGAERHAAAILLSQGLGEI